MSEQPSVELSTSTPTLAAFSDVWLAGLTASEATIRSYRHVLNRILPGLGHLTLDALDPDELVVWRAGLRTRTGLPLSASTDHSTHQVLSMLLDEAVRQGLLPRTPMRHWVGRGS